MSDNVEMPTPGSTTATTGKAGRGSAPSPDARRRTIIVIGGGPGGYVAAIRAAQLGADVTLIEREHIGGTCLNIGCIPTKCLLHSAELLGEIRDWGAEIGVDVDGARINVSQLMAHKDAVVHQLTSGVAGLLRYHGVKVVEGEARFIGQREIELTTQDGSRETMGADDLIIASGSINAVPPIPGLREVPACIDSTGALGLERLPESMVVIGGGVIGVELACAYAAFGTKVDIVEALDHVLPMLDGDLTKVGVAHMTRMGIKLHLSCPVQRVEERAGGATVVCADKDAGKEVSFEAEKVLVAVGRAPDTASLDLAAGGIDNERGAIRVNDQMQTNASGVYAIGDCVLGHARLAHTAMVMGEVAAETIMGLEARYDESTNPTCVYMEPEAASVGLTEEQCKERGIAYKAAKFSLAGNGKALIENGGEGLVKIIAEPRYDQILGMHIIGPRATDLISEGALAIRLEATVDEVMSTIHSHPTISEAVREASLSYFGRAIHARS